MLSREILLPIIGLGLYAQSQNINLSNNTTALLELFATLTQQEEINRLNRAVFGTPFLGAPYQYGYEAPLFGNPYAYPYATRLPNHCHCGV
jgi:hypothetical protein